MNEKTVIFDMDGVIFDSENLFLDCWKKIAGEYGIEGIEQVYHNTIGTKAEVTEAVFQAAYGEQFSYSEFSEKASKKFFQYVEEQGMPMKPGVRELLDYLSENGYRIGLASSTREQLVRSQLKGRGLLSYFQVIIGGDMVSKGKPAPDIFLKACEDIGVLPEHAFAVEDSYHGIRAAASAGMKAIMVPDIVPPDEEMKKLAYRICSSLAEVQDFLQKN